MKTIAQQLNVTEFPFEIKDKNGNVIYRENFNGTWSRCEYIPNSQGEETYSEDSNGFWYKREFDSNGEEIYYENSNGYVEDNRPKGCEGKLIEVNTKEKSEQFYCSSYKDGEWRCKTQCLECTGVEVKLPTTLIRNTKER